MNLLQKFFILFSFYAINTHSVVAQEWEQIIGQPNNHEKAFSGKGLQDGGAIVLSDKEDSFADLVLHRFSNSGQILWGRAYDFSLGRNAPFFEVFESTYGGFWLHGSPLVQNKGFIQVIIRLDDLGNVLWEKNINTSSTYANHNYGLICSHDFQETSDGDLITLNSTILDTIFYSLIYKLNAQGEIIWERLFDLGFEYSKPESLIETSDGNFLIGGLSGTSRTTAFPYLLKINPVGDVIWEKRYTNQVDTSIDKILSVVEIQNEGYIIGGNIKSGPLETNFQLIKTDLDGTVSWVQSFEDAPQIDNQIMLKAANKDIVFLGFNAVLNQHLLFRIAPNGDIKSTKTIMLDESYTFEEISNTSDDEFLLVGSKKEETTNSEASSDLFVLKTEGFAPDIYSNTIKGVIVLDENLNCIPENDEQKLNFWIVKAEGDQTQYGVTDVNGHYSISLDTGAYEMSLIPPVPFWETCFQDSLIQLSSFGETATLDFPVQDSLSCPFLTVDLYSPLLRRCFENTYYVQYCNLGSVNVENAEIEIVFDEHLLITSSTLPIINIVDNIYTFSTGAIAIGECQQFTINFTLDCASTQGQTHCSSAIIRPNDACILSEVDWDGASLRVTGICEPDSVRFTVINEGTGNMQEPSPYLVVEDNVMLIQGSLQLDAGQSIDFTFPANGSTYYFTVLQSHGHPGLDLPSALVEGCGEMIFSTGYAGQFPENDSDPFISSDCQRNIGSFDPNDKIGYPIGWGNDHLIEVNQEIEYRIRFQNTGTDTAFNIVVLDTLSEHLDVSTLRSIVTSHPYKMEIIDGTILKYSFENVMLPDSNVNEPASHGFLKFKINQQKDNQIGTTIFNSAAIYFDFNKPVITNETFHTIGKRLLAFKELNSETELNFIETIVYPNPFLESAQFKMKENIKGPIELIIYDVSGKQVRSNIYNSSAFTFLPKGLPSGLYFYQIRSKRLVLNTGKMIIQE